MLFLDNLKIFNRTLSFGQMIPNKIKLSNIKFYISLQIGFLAQQQNYMMKGQTPLSESPFVNEAVRYSEGRKRPSKKIRKIANSIYKSKTEISKKNKDLDQNKILNILSERNVPQFLIDFVQKKRILNMSQIRKISFGKADQNCLHSTSDFLSRQENDLCEILNSNKVWQEQRKKYVYATPVSKKSMIQTQQQGNSYSYSEMKYEGMSEEEDQKRREYPQVSMFDVLDFKQPMDMMESRDMQDSELFLRLY